MKDIYIQRKFLSISLMNTFNWKVAAVTVQLYFFITGNIKTTKPQFDNNQIDFVGCIEVLSVISCQELIFQFYPSFSFTNDKLFWLSWFLGSLKPGGFFLLLFCFTVGLIHCCCSLNVIIFCWYFIYLNFVNFKLKMGMRSILTWFQSNFLSLDWWVLWSLLCISLFREIHTLFLFFFYDKLIGQFFKLLSDY